MLAGYTDNDKEDVYEPASKVAVTGDTVFEPVWSKKISVIVTGSEVAREISFDKASGDLVTQENAEYTVKYMVGKEESDSLPEDIGGIECEITAGKASGAHTGKYTAEVSAELSGTDESYKYVIAEDGGYDSAEISLTITKAAITASVTGGSKVYGDAEPAAVGTVEYKHGNDAVTCFTPSLTREQGEDAGKYSLTFETAAPEGDNKVTLDDVVITDDSTRARFKITKKIAELEWNELEFTYDGNDHMPKAAVKNAVNDDTVSVKVVGSTKVAGIHTATAVSLSNDNYVLPDDATMTFKIVQNNLAPTVSMTGWIYGDKASTPSLVGNVSNGNVTYLYSVKGADEWSDNKPTDAGEYTVKAIISATDGYKEASATADFSIARRTAELKWENLSFIYDGSSHKPAASIDNLVRGDRVDVNVAGEQTEPGTYKATAAELTGVDAANYVLPDNAEQEFVISQSKLAPVVTMSDWTYGETASIPSVEGNAGSGAVTYRYAKEGTDDFTETKPSEAGRYIVKASIAAAGGYEAAETQTSFAIYQKTAMIEWTGTSLTYNGEKQCPEAKLINLVEGDVCDVTVEGAKTDAGEYNARAVSLSNANYKLPDTVTQVFIIAKANIDYDSKGFSGTVDGNAHSITVTAIEPENAEIRYGTSKDSIELENNPEYKDAGTYTVYYRISAGDNYNTVTGKENVQILAKPSSGGSGGGGITPTPTPEPTPAPEPEPTPEPTPDPEPVDRSQQMGEDGTALGKGASAEAAEAAILGMTSDADPAGSKIMPLRLRSLKQTKKTITLKWTTPSDAVKYVIYGNMCNSKTVKRKMQKIKITSKKTFKVKKLANGKKLKKGTYHKFIVVALDKDNNVVSTSKVIHVATKGGKVGNPKSVKVKTPKKLKKTLKAGKTFKIKAKQIDPKKVKVQRHIKVNGKKTPFRYESSNTKVATVTKSGKVKAVSAGTAKICVYAQNGVNKLVNITVK